MTELISMPAISSDQQEDQLVSILDEDDQQVIYRLLAKKYHPDVCKNGGEKMARINQMFKKQKWKEDGFDPDSEGG